MAKVSTDLPAGMQALLDQCIGRQLYGGEAATVRAFITMGIERLVEQGRLVDAPVPAVQPQAPEPQGNTNDQKGQG